MRCHKSKILSKCPDYMRYDVKNENLPHSPDHMRCDVEIDKLTLFSGVYEIRSLYM